MVPRGLCIVALVTSVLLPIAAKAELVIDDFDVPSFDLPDHPTRHSDPQPVGDLNLLRVMQFFGSGAEPQGLFDSAITAPSQFTATIEEANAVDDPLVQIDQRLLYRRDYPSATIPFDLSENGRNTALIFDFLRLEGSRPPDQLRIYISAHRTTYEHRYFELPITSEPFSLVIPFSAFWLRAGGPPPPVPAFGDTHMIDIAFRSGRFADRYELSLDRIRVGAIVPEPPISHLVLVILTLVSPCVLKGSTAHFKVRRRVVNRSKTLMHKGDPQCVD